MAFVALVVALLIEQARALPSANPVYVAFRRYARVVERALDGGRYEQGVVAWLLVIAPIVLAVAGISVLLDRIAPPIALLWNIGVLYLTMGFRQFSFAFTEVLNALRAGDIARARVSTQQWRGLSADNLSAAELARLAIERGLSGAHRHVFGVIAWFVAFGAAGAVFYRLAAMLRDSWGERIGADEAEFGHFSRRVFGWCDWVPVRLSAVSFAVVGDFEDAIYCWRTQAAAWSDPLQGIVLASGAGAIGVRLGSVLGSTEPVEVRPELGIGDEADAELMTSAVGLIWRALVLWMFVILLLTVANWFG